MRKINPPQPASKGVQTRKTAMKPTHEIRHCEVCGTPMHGKRVDATVCSDNCRVIKHQRKKQAEQQPPVIEPKVEEVPPPPKPNAYTAPQDSPANFPYIAQQLLADTNQMKKSIDSISEEIEQKQYQINQIIARQTEAKANLGIAQTMYQNLLRAHQQEEEQQKKQAKAQARHEHLLATDERYAEADRIKTLSECLDFCYQNFTGKTTPQTSPTLPTPRPSEMAIIAQKAELEGYAQLLKEFKDELKYLKETKKEYQKRLEYLEKYTYRTMRTQDFRAQSTPQVSPTLSFEDEPVQEEYKPSPTARQHTGAQVRNMRITPTLLLPYHMNDHLGDLERDKCFASITGDAGAGKTTFSFYFAHLFDKMGLKVAYFSLEVGISNQVKKLVRHYKLSERFSITDIATPQDIEESARKNDVVIVDSFGKVYETAKEIDFLRNAYPQTIFVGIFQKTTAGTMRGGSAVIYDSSASWDIYRDATTQESYLHVVKSRYGKTGTKVSLTQIMSIQP